MPNALTLLLERLWTGWRGAPHSHGNTESRFLMDLPVQRHWGARVAFYLYLGGTGGAFVFLEVVLRWLGVISEATAVWGMWIGIVLSLLSVLAIFDHLGPVARWRFWYAFRRPKRSWISRGVIIVTALVGARLLVVLPTIPALAGLPWAEGTPGGEMLRAAVIVLAVAFMLYSGLVISSWNAIAFWNSPLLPVLFTAFSFLGGLTALPIVAGVAEGLPAMADLGAVVSPYALALAALDAVLLFLYVQGMSTGSRPARVSTAMLLRGSVRSRFLGGVVGLGLVLPAVLVAVALGAATGEGSAFAALLIVAGASIQVGGFLLRDAVLRVGVYGPPL